MCGFAMQVSIPFLYFYKFCYHSGVVLSLLDTLSVPFCEGPPIQLIFPIGDHTVRPCSREFTLHSAVGMISLDGNSVNSTLGKSCGSVAELYMGMITMQLILLIYDTDLNFEHYLKKTGLYLLGNTVKMHL